MAAAKAILITDADLIAEVNRHATAAGRATSREGIVLIREALAARERLAARRARRRAGKGHSRPLAFPARRDSSSPPEPRP